MILLLIIIIIIIIIIIVTITITIIITITITITITIIIIIIIIYHCWASSWSTCPYNGHLIWNPRNQSSYPITYYSKSDECTWIKTPVLFVCCPRDLS